MKQETWTLINRQFARFRSSWSDHIDEFEFDEAFQGFPIAPDYREFILRCGGGIVGLYPIYGLRLAEAMGTIGHKSTAPEITRVFRERKWPAVENWLVISVDGAGNPIGLTEDGSVWISDSPRGQVQKLADTFEAFVLKWGFKINGLTEKTT